MTHLEVQCAHVGWHLLKRCLDRDSLAGEQPVEDKHARGVGRRARHHLGDSVEVIQIHAEAARAPCQLQLEDLS